MYVDLYWGLLKNQRSLKKRLVRNSKALNRYSTEAKPLHKPKPNNRMYTQVIQKQEKNHNRAST